MVFGVRRALNGESAGICSQPSMATSPAIHFFLLNCAQTRRHNDSLNYGAIEVMITFIPKTASVAGATYFQVGFMNVTNASKPVYSTVPL
jgi:hypothetical protein